MNKIGMRVGKSGEYEKQDLMRVKLSFMISISLVCFQWLFICWNCWVAIEGWWLICEMGQLIVILCLWINWFSLVIFFDYIEIKYY